MKPALERPAVGREPAFVTRVRLRARRRVLWMRSLWDSYPLPAQHGLAIPDAEVDRILAARLPSAEKEYYAGHAEARELTREIEVADEAAAADPRWRRLTTGLSLEPAETDLLALALTVEIDPWWRRVCGYLHDDATQQQATPWLAASLFHWTPDTRLGPSGSLLRWRLARPSESAADPWSTSAPWLADPQLVPWLLREHDAQPPPGPGAEWIAAPGVPCLYPDELETTHRFSRFFLQGRDTPAELEIAAPQGAGKRTLVTQLAARLAKPLLAVSPGPGDGDAERLTCAVRLARLEGAILYLGGAETLDERLWIPLRGRIPLAVHGVSARRQWPPHPGIVRQSVLLPRLNAADRNALWLRLTGGRPAPGFLADAPLLPAELSAAARSLAAGSDAVRETCRALLYHSPGDLFQELPLPYEWRDIVLPDSMARQLEEIEAQVRLRSAVLDDWGFERLTPMGRGFSALFAGPSGTGKTMAAQVVARSLGLALRRVDLSAVVNKYIGETEKRLKLVFDACERDQAILFFDEADALFGKRTEVKDAHDRYANIEVNYLLQRMEGYDGLAILATNRKEDLDRAFLRRLRFIVDFPPPGPAERLRLWKRMLPEKSPAGLPLLEANLKFDIVARSIEITGASIQSAALRAAFLARAAGARIGASHIHSAVRSELAKNGRTLRDSDLEALP